MKPSCLLLEYIKTLDESNGKSAQEEPSCNKLCLMAWQRIKDISQ